MDRERLVSSRMLEREAQLPSTKMKEQLQLNLEHGLESAESVRDRTIPLFNRLGLRFHHGGTFAARPFLRDMRELDGQDVAAKVHLGAFGRARLGECDERQGETGQE